MSLALRAEFTSEQADVLASALAVSTQDTVATKADIIEKAATKAGLLELKVDLVRWIVTAIAFNFVATAGLLLGFARLYAKSSLMRRSRG